MAEFLLRLENLVKFFGALKAVDQVSLDVKRGEVFTLLGPSGCGKTTTLRLVAGLEEPDGGEILYDDVVIVSAEKKVFVPPHRRNMGMVFQSYAIWPNMTVLENIAYPLRARRLPGGVIRRKVQEILELVDLAGLEKKPASFLSGGQQQRVALARALVYEPPLLLLDEPFSNLDAKLREQMRVELKLLQKKLSITTLFVTHDQVEALSLSNRIAVVNNGVIEQVGTPSEVYKFPKTAFVRDFLGKSLILKGSVECVTREGKLGVKLKQNCGLLYCKNPSMKGISPSEEVYVAIRPEDVIFRPTLGGTTNNLIGGTVDTILFVGERYEIQVRIDSGDSILCYLHRDQGCVEGEKVQVMFPEDRVTVWRPQ